MPLVPKLSPLQSRFAACLSASVVLLLVYLALTKPQFAYAQELDSRIPHEDHNHYLILEDGEFDESEEDRLLQPRAEDGVSALANNGPQNRNIEIGALQNWVFPKEAINGPHGDAGTGLPGVKRSETPLEADVGELNKRQSGSTVYISLNTCLQPLSNTTDAIPPQLEMFVSLSSANQKPGPGNGTPVSVIGGYAEFQVSATDDVFVGIAAPNTTAFTGIWNYEVAASIDAPFHSYNSSAPQNLFFVDSDNHAALLITDNTTQAEANETVYQEWMKLKPPYSVFASDQNQRSILGVQRSFCGLMNNAKVAANMDNVTNQDVTTMTNRGLGGKPKQQFYITGLNATSNYWGMLVIQGNSTASGNGVVGGGGTVWPAISFATKTEDNCALMYNLSFCSEVAYAVPTNPDKFSPETGLLELAALYDSHAAQMYQYFNYSLQQIPCNTTASAQYSLARTCDDCARAYKQWLCAVTIPRCADFNNPATYLMPRNVGQDFVNGSSISSISSLNSQQAQSLLSSVATNSSRNPLIDTSIAPGPYKEVLPCEDLCYDLIQSCPASLGFACPLKGKGLEQSYGTRFNQSDGILSCSYLGAAFYLSDGSALKPTLSAAGLALGVILLGIVV
jgi:calcium channel MID1